MLEMERDLKECFAELTVEQQTALIDWLKKHLVPGETDINSSLLKPIARNALGFYIRNEQMKRAMELAGIEIEDKSVRHWVPLNLRYCGRIIQPGSFLARLDKKRDKDSILGDFAHDAMGDESFPSDGNYQTFCSYLQPLFSNNRSGWNAFKRAWRAYQKEAHKEA